MNKQKCLLYLLLCTFWYTNTIQTESKDIWVTVFMHGSFSLKPHLSLRNFLKMLYDAIEESIYYRATEINRRDPFFYKNQAISDLGLHQINLENPNKANAAPIVALSFEKICQRAGYPPSNLYYTFGWSGLVSNKLRYIEGSFLYKDLSKLTKDLKQQGYNPKVRLIGYSHGGNLGLQLGAFHQTQKKEDQFTIEEFHLIGTPIQVETDYLINSPVFKKVYNWYSRSDNVQNLDCFSFKRWFSKKKFSPRKNFTLPNKLTQIRIKVSDFIPKKKQYSLLIPKNKKELYKYFTEISYDPGHFELWFMGWTILTYRKTFPTHPLPIMAFLPLLTKEIEQHPELGKDLVADIQTCFDRVELYPYKKSKRYQRIMFPFVDLQTLASMKEFALKFTPEDYNIETYNRKVTEAISIVKKELKDIREITKQDELKKDAIKHKPTINLHRPNTTYQGHLLTEEALNNFLIDEEKTA